jgi:2-polyprenyl-6-methoxyphenol hydroxylase-like FAD-dependent oxidoreductase
MSDDKGASSTRRPSAVVIGGSVTGLCAATVLAQYADVTIVERDTLPEGSGPRKGVPQSRHAHVVWSGGVLAFNDLLPGFVDELVNRGARLVPIMSGMVSKAPSGVWFRRWGNSRHYNLVCSRDLFDAALRDQVLRLPHITLRQAHAVEGLTGDTSRVTGVRVRSAERSATLTADLVVDASGRASRAPHWLKGLGLPEVAERRVDAGVTYATRFYEAPGSTVENDFPLVSIQADPSRAAGQGGIILPVEDNKWIVTLSGTRGGEPTKEPDDFVPFALGLSDPVIGELIKDARPLSGVTTTRSTANVRRYYEKMERFPEAFAVLGDAIAGYNPVYGHGLTVSAQSAIALRDVLHSSSVGAPGVGRRIQRAAARPVSGSWSLAVGQDALYPGAAAKPPTVVEKALSRYVDRAVATGARNPRALGALLDVMSLEKPATRLFSPDMLIPMLFGPKAAYLAGPPLSDAERKAAAS